MKKIKKVKTTEHIKIKLSKKIENVKKGLRKL